MSQEPDFKAIYTNEKLVQYQYPSVTEQVDETSDAVVYLKDTFSKDYSIQTKNNKKTYPVAQTVHKSSVSQCGELSTSEYNLQYIITTIFYRSDSLTGAGQTPNVCCGMISIARCLS